MIPEGFIALGYINYFTPQVHSNLKRPFVGKGTLKVEIFSCWNSASRQVRDPLGAV